MTGRWAVLETDCSQNSSIRGVARHRNNRSNFRSIPLTLLCIPVLPRGVWLSEHAGCLRAGACAFAGSSVKRFF